MAKQSRASCRQRSSEAVASASEGDLDSGESVFAGPEGEPPESSDLGHAVCPEGEDEDLGEALENEVREKRARLRLVRDALGKLDARLVLCDGTRRTLGDVRSEYRSCSRQLSRAIDMEAKLKSREARGRPPLRPDESTERQGLAAKIDQWEGRTRLLASVIENATRSRTRVGGNLLTWEELEREEKALREALRLFVDPDVEAETEEHETPDFHGASVDDIVGHYAPDAYDEIKKRLRKRVVQKWLCALLRPHAFQTKGEAEAFLQEELRTGKTNAQKLTDFVNSLPEEKRPYRKAPQGAKPIIYD